MTLQEILDLRDQFLEFDLDDSFGRGSTTTDQQKVNAVNSAIRQLSLYVQQVDPKMELNLVEDQDTYDLRASCSRKCTRPYQVVVNGRTLWNAAWNERGVWTLQELEREHPSWRTDPSGSPTKAVVYSHTKVIIHPRPDADSAAATNYVSGTYMAADMTTGDVDDSPDLPEELHEAVAYLAAVKGALPYASEAEGWQRLQAYNSEWQATAEEVRRENLRLLQAWGSTSGYSTPDTIWM